METIRTNLAAPLESRTRDQAAPASSHSPPSAAASRSRFAEVFDHIYILNLPDRADRRREILAELRRCNFPLPGDRLTFFPGVRATSADGFPSVGCHGCYLGHLAIFKDALREKYGRILILEDDLTFSPLLAQHDALMAELAAKVPWHFAYFGHIRPPDPAHQTPSLQITTDPLVTCHFYALNQSVLAPLIDFFEAAMRRKPGDPAGGPMYNDAACNMFRAQNPLYITVVASTSLGHQRPSRSDIIPKWFDRAPGLKQAASLLRRVKDRLEHRGE